MICVFGATGMVGGKVAAMLMESGVPVRALVRSPEKAQPLAREGAAIVEGSLLNLDDVKAALEGCTGAFLMTPINRASERSVEEEISIGHNYAQALKDSDVEHVVYMSVVGARANTGVPHMDSKAVIEEAISSSGVDCTFLRPTFFMENIYRQIQRAQELGVISYPLAPDDPLAMVATEDVAYAAAQSLQRGGRGKLEEYEMFGPRDYLMTEVAEILGRALGKDIRYVESTEQEAEQMFAEMGARPGAGKEYVAMVNAIKDLHPEFDRNRIYREFNFEPTTLETVLEMVAGAVRA